jgi:hypothetical protein
MGSLALERLESLLKTRQLDRTLTRHWTPGATRELREVASAGAAALDADLGGGWPRGEVSEIVGRASTGRTRVLMAALGSATRRGEIVGLVDALDRFDPVSAAAAGVDLDRLLWVRGTSLTVESARPSLIEFAVRQGIRAFDLIVRAGGFSLAALDLANVPPRAVRMLPHTTWMRLAHANEGRQTAGLLIGDAPMGRSARGVTVTLEAASRWTGASPQSRRLAGLDMRPHVVGMGMGTKVRHWALGTGHGND